ncbi:hypothetical protein Q8F55_005494 [Vanrija albida]|uniref:Uncharacterized protein n=1 Tax=Vanrija albida TaxID=181172 RepID=A0ABR3Q200_9TREE
MGNLASRAQPKTYEQWHSDARERTEAYRLVLAQRPRSTHTPPSSRRHSAYFPPPSPSASAHSHLKVPSAEAAVDSRRHSWASANYRPSPLSTSYTPSESSVGGSRAGSITRSIAPSITRSTSLRAPSTQTPDTTVPHVCWCLVEPGDPVPDDAIPVGFAVEPHNLSALTLYAARTFIGGSWRLGHIASDPPYSTQTWYLHPGHRAKAYEILCGTMDALKWVPVDKGKKGRPKVPPGRVPVEAGKRDDGSPIYVARVPIHLFVKVKTGRRGTVPGQWPVTSGTALFLIDDETFWSTDFDILVYKYPPQGSQ